MPQLSGSPSLIWLWLYIVAAIIVTLVAGAEHLSRTEEKQMEPG